MNDGVRGSPLLHKVFRFFSLPSVNELERRGSFLFVPAGERGEAQKVRYTATVWEIEGGKTAAVASFSGLEVILAVSSRTCAKIPGDAVVTDFWNLL